MKRVRASIDRFLLLLLVTVLLATLLPARGTFALVSSAAATLAIVALFFLHGAKLARGAILAGTKAWRLHVCVLGTTFLAFPLIGLAVAHFPIDSARDCDGPFIPDAAAVHGSIDDRIHRHRSAATTSRQMTFVACISTIMRDLLCPSFLRPRSIASF